MDVNPIPGLEHLPYAEVWFHEVDERRWREASARARALGKSGLEVWTTDRTLDDQRDRQGKPGPDERAHEA